MLDEDMPSRLNEQLQLNGHAVIDYRAGNDPLFARVIFESLAARYESALRSLEHMLDGYRNGLSSFSCSARHVVLGPYHQGAITYDFDEMSDKCLPTVLITVNGIGHADAFENRPDFMT